MMVIMSVSSIFVFPPPPSLLVSAMSAISFASLALIGFLETKGMHLQYSKFWNNGSDENGRRRRRKKPIELSSKVGMLVAYVPAFLLAAASFFFGIFPHGTFFRVFLLQSASTLYFFKRIFEVMFVHKYSGSVSLGTIIFVVMAYFLGTATLLYTQHFTLGFPEPPIDLKYFGIVLFLIGISGNFYHHYLLSKLRGKCEKEYKIPKGGLFGLVVCPHYLFEILEFCGISFISQTTYAFAFTLGSMFYLIGRSYATKRWYLSKFENFSQGVKAIIPFIF